MVSGPHDLNLFLNNTLFYSCWILFSETKPLWARMAWSSPYRACLSQTSQQPMNLVGYEVMRFSSLASVL